MKFEYSLQHTFNLRSGNFIQMRCSFFLIIVLVLGVNVELQAKSTYVDGMTNEEFVERFSDLVFGKDRSEGEKLSKFMRPVRIIFYGSNKNLIEKYRPKFELTLKMLREDIGIDIAIKNDDEDNGKSNNFAVLISDTPIFDMLVELKDIVKLFMKNDIESFYEKIMYLERENFNTFNSYLAMPSNELVACLNIQNIQTHKGHTESVDIAKRIEIGLLYCIGFHSYYFEDDQFSTQALNHSRTKYSLTDVSYSDFDIAAMKMLYNKDLHAGMSYEEVKKTITQIISVQD